MNLDGRLKELEIGNHEAAHGASCLLLGLTVDRIGVDHMGSVDGKLGWCESSFRHDDPRPRRDKCMARSIISLSAVLISPGQDGQADSDLVSVGTWAGVAGEPAEEWLADASERTWSLIGTKLFNELMKQLAFGLLERRELSWDDVLAIMKTVPGASTYNLYHSPSSHARG